MMDFTKEETAMLVGQGFEIGWMGDVKDGDTVAIAPVTRISFSDDTQIKTIKTLVVKRVQPMQADYYDEDNGLVRNVIILFFGYDLDGLPEHCTYGSTYPCFIKRGDTTN